MLFYDVGYSFKAPLKVGHDVPYTFGIIGDLGQSYASNQTLEHYMSNPNGQAVLFIRIIQTFQTIQASMSCTILGIMQYAHSYERSIIMPQLEPLNEQQLASGSSLRHSFQQAEVALTRNGKTSADFDLMCY
ncbi:hypothetical protein OROHE_023951 [Orobanche hederae]